MKLEATNASGVRFNENALLAFRPRSATADSWSDYWYYYVNDPDVGYFKIAFLTYRSAGSPECPLRTYLHIAFYPLVGAHREFEVHCDDVSVGPGDGSNPYSFRFTVPGVATITETRLEVTLPEASLTVDLSRDHVHYWNGINPAHGPFSSEAETPPSETGHWFIFTLGTPSSYEYRDTKAHHRGGGLTYAERGWSTSAAPGFTYLVATSDKVKLMLVEGGRSSGGDTEFWAGQVLVGGEHLLFLPQPGNHTVSSEIDSSSGLVRVELVQGAHRLVVRSQAALSDFHDSHTPSQTVFRSDFPVMKTMNAALELTLFRDGITVEEIALAQSLLEFAGAAYSPNWRDSA